MQKQIPPGQNCASCAYGIMRDEVRECRAHPPTHYQPVPRGSWPIVQDTDWCGEYK